MKCPHCHFENPQGSAFCGDCGKPLKLDVVYQDSWHATLQSLKFCTKCGQPLVKGASESTPRPNATSYAKGCFQTKNFVGQRGERKMNGNLKRLRGTQALSLTDLERISGVNRTTINRIENGKRKAMARTVRKLAKALQVKVEELTS
jgi:DNA-binding XRE family transcriptional regulator